MDTKVEDAVIDNIGKDSNDDIVFDVTIGG